MIKEKFSQNKKFYEIKNFMKWWIANKSATPKLN